MTTTKTIQCPQAVVDELLRTMSRSYWNGGKQSGEASVCGWAEGIDIDGLHYYADIEATAEVDSEPDSYDEPGWETATVKSIDFLDGVVRDDDDNPVATLDFDVQDFIGALL